MFGISDIPKFFLAFFLVLPVISLLHESGHVFFAWLMGGKKIRVSIGTGDRIFNIGMLEVRKYYFWYGLCTFENLKRNERLSNILIFFGGALFNALGAFAVIALIENRVLDPTIITYQFTYFSLYYIFFALLPMPYPDGTYSDGKIMLDLIRNKRSVIRDREFYINWHEKQEKWQVLDQEENLLFSSDNREEALLEAREVARNSRPSRIVDNLKENKQEIHNFPRIPL